MRSDVCLAIVLVMQGCGGDDDGSASGDCGRTFTVELSRWVEVNGLHLAPDGSAIVTGVVDDQEVDFGDGPWRPDTLGSFVVAYAADGALRFRRALDGPASQRLRDSAVADDGGFVAVGEFVRELDAGGEVLTGAGATDAFVGRFAADGSPTWMRAFGSTGDDTAVAVDVTIDGAVAASGKIGGDIDFDGTALSPVNDDSWWIAELALSDGAVRWATTTTGPSGPSIAAGPGGVTFVGAGRGGQLGDGTPFGPFEGNAAVAVHLSRADGSIAWVKGFEGSTPTSGVQATALITSGDTVAIAAIIRGDGGVLDGMSFDSMDGVLHALYGAAPDGAPAYVRIDEVQFERPADAGRVIMRGSVRDGLTLGGQSVPAGTGSAFALYDPMADEVDAIHVWATGVTPRVAARGRTIAAFVDPAPQDPKTLIWIESAPSSPSTPIQALCGTP